MEELEKCATEYKVLEEKYLKLHIVCEKVKAKRKELVLLEEARNNQEQLTQRIKALKSEAQSRKLKLEKLRQLHEETKVVADDLNTQLKGEQENLNLLMSNLTAPPFPALRVLESHHKY